jgi:SAM-dependent methyltransferase
MRVGRLLLAAVGAALAGIVALVAARGTMDGEAARLRPLLDWNEGAHVADVGAGNGAMTRAMAKAVGPTGRVYATEIEANKLAGLRSMVTQRGLDNVDVIEGFEAATNLPEGCCDSLLLRRVYHHIMDPKSFDASLARALKPGAKLAIVDFPPSVFLGLIAPVKGAPPHRGRHGIRAEVIVDEMSNVGLTLLRRDDHWRGGGYCLVFQKRPR